MILAGIVTFVGLCGLTSEAHNGWDDHFGTCVALTMTAAGLLTLVGILP